MTEVAGDTAVDTETLQAALADERRRFVAEHPRSRERHERARGSLLGGVPMSWMARWAGGFPPVVAEARGATLVDVDGRHYADFCLGDTGAMAGHAPQPVVRAVAEQAARGLTTMLPGEDAAWVGEELARRFGLPLWQLALTATDANRFALRIAREITQRPRVLVFNYCYHGSVDEALVTLRPDGGGGARAGNVGPAVDPGTTTRVVEFNDLGALERELAHGDVACVLTEPALTNIGIVLPLDGFHAALRELTRAAGTLLVIDETHTLSAAPGGCTQAWGLEPDLVTVGKAIAGGVPAAAFGLTHDVAERLAARPEADLEDVGGVGGTLAGNPLSVAAIRATLEHVLTDEAWERTVPLAERFAAGVEEAVADAGLPWHVARLGCRAEYRFAPEPPRDGGASAALADPELEAYLHLYALNRGVLLTPFHNMALMCPATTADDVDLHSAVFREAVGPLV